MRRSQGHGALSPLLCVCSSFVSFSFSFFFLFPLFSSSGAFFSFLWAAFFSCDALKGTACSLPAPPFPSPSTPPLTHTHTHTHKKWVLDGYRSFCFWATRGCGITSWQRLPTSGGRTCGATPTLRTLTSTARPTWTTGTPLVPPAPSSACFLFFSFLFLFFVVVLVLG